jgi:uncharacterized protein YuzE
VRITYDADADAAYIYLTEIEPGGVATTVPGWPGTEAFMVNLDFDAEKHLVGIEIMDASVKLPPDFLSQLNDHSAEPL